MVDKQEKPIAHLPRGNNCMSGIGIFPPIHKYFGSFGICKYYDNDEVTEGDDDYLVQWCIHPKSKESSKDRVVLICPLTGNKP